MLQDRLGVALVELEPLAGDKPVVMFFMVKARTGGPLAPVTVTALDGGPPVISGACCQVGIGTQQPFFGAVGVFFVDYVGLYGKIIGGGKLQTVGGGFQYLVDSKFLVVQNGVVQCDGFHLVDGVHGGIALVVG